jgi:L-ascorbate metabolism protein UlaG (beta-lactamase superfamily)
VNRVRVTLLGHASLLVELEGATCLMDPVLQDPFEEGVVVSCPRRTIDVGALPPIDLLVVSHRHPDHFDLPSLARVDRSVDAICPADPLIAYALAKLGFASVHPVHPMAPISSADFELYPTRSELASIPEMGVVFHDRSGTVWNQVDTPLADGTIAQVRGRFGAPDVLLAMHASQNFEFFESLSAVFPFQTHARNLETAMRIGPRVVVPASAGFRFCGEHEWLNAFLFPISRDRFATDLRRLMPDLDVTLMDPGDVLEVGDGEVEHHRAASSVARTESDDTARLRFDPSATVPALVDSNPDGYSTDQLERAVTEVEHDIGRWAMSSRRDTVVDAYTRHGVRYRIGVVFPDGLERWHAIDFSTAPPCPRDGSRDPPDADLVHRITASALTGWVDYTRSFFSVRACSRRYGSAYTLARVGDDVLVEPQPLPDLLMYYLLRVRPGAEVSARTEVDRQLERLGVR